MTWTTRPRSELAGVAAIVAGQGPDVVLIHGVGLRAEAFSAQITALSAQFRVTALDMPGHGGTPALRDPQDLLAYVAALAPALPDRCLVAGHSMGAMLALELSAQHPDKVAGVAALNAIYRRSPKAAQSVQARANDMKPPFDHVPTLIRWFGSGDSPERTACAGWLNAADPAGYTAAYRVFAHADGPSEAALRALACPALFMTGALEPNSTPAMSQQMAALAPQGRAEIVAGAAHMMPMTHPAPVNAALIALAQDALG